MTGIIQRLREGRLISIIPQPRITIVLPDGAEQEFDGGTVEVREQHPLANEAADTIEELLDALKTLDAFWSHDGAHPDEPHWTDEMRATWHKLRATIAQVEGREQ